MINHNNKFIIYPLLLLIMAGEYYGYYDREGRGKRKKYRCLLCNHKLPTLSGITSHLSRTHGEEISKDKRRIREWKENQQRKKQEKIEQEREDKEFAEIQLKEYAAMIPRLKEKNRLIKKRKAREIEQRLLEEKKKKEMWDEAKREVEKERVRKAKVRFKFLSTLEKSDMPWQKEFIYLDIAKQIGMV